MGELDVVRGYFAACSRGDAAGIAAHFTDDATVYDTNHPPVRGAAEIGRFYAQVQAAWGGAVWHIDTFLGGASAAASEWTMLGRHRDRVVAVRGSEHYEFRDERISEIRQYWTYDRDDPEVGLRDFPYVGDERFAMPDRH